VDVNKLKKAALHLGLLILLYVLQTDVFTRLRIDSVCPMLLPIAAVGFGLFEGGLRGGLWGIAAGIFCDISAGTNFLFTIYLCAVGFTAGFLSEFVMARGFPSFFVMNAVALPFGALLQIFPLIVYHNAPPAPLFISLLIQAAYSMIFVIPVYFLVRRAARGRGIL
jgi:hypothetical protein